MINLETETHLCSEEDDGCNGNCQPESNDIAEELARLSHNKNLGKGLRSM
jgi:hypothetical protein